MTGKAAPARLQQVFPRKEGQRLVHRAWTVDLAAAWRLFSARSAARGRDQARLKREIEEMGAHFPRWVLTVAVGRDRLTCRGCSGPLVFDRGLRCALCEGDAVRLPRGARLAWFGLLPPVGIDGLQRIADSIAARPPRHHVVGQRPDIGRYLLVPLLAIYPTGFPRQALQVVYLPGLFEIEGMPPPRPSHEAHLLSDGFLCLFAPGDWRSAMSCREVLQQRAYPHLIKLLNYANGKRSAFAIVS